MTVRSALGLVLGFIALASCRDPAPAQRAASVAQTSPGETQARPAHRESPRTEQAPRVAEPPPTQSEYVEALVGPDPGPAGRVVIVAIHGLGDSPESFVNWLRQAPVSARVLAVRGTESYGNGFAWWLPGGGEEAIARAVDRAASTIAARVSSKLDAGRCGKTIVLGFSQGGMVSFAIAARGSMDVGLVMPIGGRLPVDNRGVTRPAGQRPIVRAFHGEADERMPIVGARTTVDALARQGMDATLRSFAGVGHSIPDEVRQAVFDEIVTIARAGGCAPR